MNVVVAAMVDVARIHKRTSLGVNVIVIDSLRFRCS